MGGSRALALGWPLVAGQLAAGVLGPLAVSFSAGSTAPIPVTGLGPGETVSSVTGSFTVSGNSIVPSAGLVAGSYSPLVTTSTGRTLTIAVTANAGADPNRWMFAATNLHQQYQVATTDANSLSSISSRKIGLPDWPVKSVRPVFKNSIMQQNSGTPELDTGNPVSISWSIQDGDGTYKQGTIGGQQIATVASGGFAIGDALTVNLSANADAFFRTLCTVANVGDKRPAGIPRQQHRGEGIENTASPQPAKLTSATAVSVVNASNGTALAGFFTPVGLLVQGWDGREVAVIFGDSQSFADGDIGRTVGARGVNGPIQRGLDDVGGGAKRIPFVNLAMSGTSPNNVSRTSGQAQRLFEMLDGIKAINGGKDPFTTVLSEHINNAVTASVSQLRTDMTNYLTRLRTEFPAAKIKQVSAMQRTLSGNFKWTTVEDQTWAAENKFDGARFIISDEMMAKTGAFASLIDVALNLRPNYAGGPNLDAWRPMPFSTTLAAAVNTASTTVKLTANPLASYPDNTEAPLVLAFDVGTANVKAANSYILLSCVSDGAGAFDATFNASIPATLAAGATVVEVPTSDGAHSSASNNQRLAVPAFRAFKQQGLIG